MLGAPSKCSCSAGAFWVKMTILLLLKKFQQRKKLCSLFEGTVLFRKVVKISREWFVQAGFSQFS
jgi:hypothetical protein